MLDREIMIIITPHAKRRGEVREKLSWSKLNGIVKQNKHNFPYGIGRKVIQCNETFRKVSVGYEFKMDDMDFDKDVLLITTVLPRNKNDFSKGGRRRYRNRK